jgi:hypothetical protein
MNFQRSLTLLGKVDRKSLKKIDRSVPARTENTWFFADYTNMPFKVNECFDTLLKGPEKTLVPGKVNIKIKEILDQFGNNHKVIPQGFKTILLLEFSPSVPPLFHNMPTLIGWEFNENSISLTHHEDVKLAEAGVEPVSLYRVFISHVRTEFQNPNTISKRRFINFLVSSRNVRTKLEATRLLNKFKILGLVTERKGEELELVDE